MFKSCCARPNKKLSKSKSASEKMDLINENTPEPTKPVVQDAQCQKPNATVTETHSSGESETNGSSSSAQFFLTGSQQLQNPNSERKVSDSETLSENKKDEVIINDPPPEDTVEDDTLKNVPSKIDLTKKRFSVDFKRARTDFKRYSVDLRRDTDTLEELERLELELAKTNVGVRPEGRRKSTGILKSTTSSCDVTENRSVYKEESESEEDEVFAANVPPGGESEGPREPPATPVGRDELALRRHRFFSDLVCAARAAVEHRVRFDPLGPMVADLGTEAEALTGAHCQAAELEALIERLERVTSRLEKLPLLRERSSTPPRSPAPSPASLPPSEELVFELTDSMSLNGYQDLLQGPLRTYLDLSKQIGGDVATHANLVNAAFQAQLRYIQLSTSRGKPSQSEEQGLLKPTSDQIAAIQAFREKNRASPFFNHLSAISESVPALGWVAVAPTPAPYVKEMNDAGQFYTNRVLKEWKEKDKRHAEWCRAWVQTLADLQAYVKQHHTTGLVWSGKGPGAGAPPPPPGGMPPPPPVLPDVDFSNLSVDDRSALFAEINQGENITSSLRKVTSDMQTHKNPQLRTGPAPFKAASAPAKGPTKALPQPGAGTFADKPPVFARDGKKWLIEYQKGNSNLVVENADMNNVVYMFRCRDSALTVRGKVNGVVLDSCTKCAVVFDNLVSSIEFVNCQSVQMQVLGKVPTVSIDKTDGCQIYLSPESLNVEIVSSKSSEMNVLVPKGNGDYSEFPIPEQFKTVLKKGSGLTTTPVESTG